MRLFTSERQLLSGRGLGSVVVDCKSTGDSTGGRAHNPLPLSVVDRGAGKRSVLVSGDDEDEGHLSQPSARASERKQAYDMDGNSASAFSSLV